MTASYVCSIVIILLWCFSNVCVTASGTIPAHRYQLDPYPFEYGVASGDPLGDAVLLWTRATNQSVVVWSIWVEGSGSFEENVTSGVAITSEGADFVVHIDATGLMPRTRYSYAFEAQGVRSRIGRTKTAPAPDDEGVDSIRIATFSCSCHWCGYMNSYREIAEDAEIDVVISLGDWLYLPPSIVNYNGVCARVPKGMCYTGVTCDKLLDIEGIPEQEQESCDGSDPFRLTDMRHYHKILNADVDVRALRAAHPIILMPDNHDINDDISSNINASVEIKVWMEWVPTRHELDSDGTVFFPRQYQYGTLLDIVRMDTRNMGKNEDPPTYLGQRQIDFFENTVFGANKTSGWRVLLSTQVFMPWTIQESGYLPPLFGLIMAINGPLLAGLVLCVGVRYKSQQKTVDGGAKAVTHYVDKVKGEKEEEEETSWNPASTQNLRRVGNCCVSNRCMAFVVFLVCIFFGLGVAAVFVARYFMEEEGVGDNASTVPNIQSSRGLAWDGLNNPRDRSNFLAQMKRLDAANNNIFVTGDMHMSLAADVLDTAIGIGPPELRPGDTTRFGVEFLPSSVTKRNLDESVSNELSPILVPLVKWLFESTLYNSNPHFRFFEAHEHGYGTIDITPEQAVFTWRFQRFDVAGLPSRVAKRMTCTKDKNRYNS